MVRILSNIHVRVRGGTSCDAVSFLVVDGVGCGGGIRIHDGVFIACLGVRSGPWSQMGAWPLPSGLSAMMVTLVPSRLGGSPHQKSSVCQQEEGGSFRHRTILIYRGKGGFRQRRILIYRSTCGSRGWPHCSWSETAGLRNIQGAGLPIKVYLRKSDMWRSGSKLQALDYLR